MICTRDKAVSIRQQKQKVGFTSGVFDILHSGHVQYLRDAKAMCDFLIVGVNSNKSVRMNKGEKRPIQDEMCRAEIVDALKSVDIVFIFDDLNNNTNVKMLKPDVYIKAGDYDESEMTSAPLVRSYGGDIKIVKFRTDKSTSKIIDRIISLHEKSSKTIEKAVFLDRDGVLIEKVDHVHEPEKVKIMNGVKEGLKKLSDYGLIVVTNQMGIGMGYFSVEDFFAVNRKMLHDLDGVIFEKIYYCPHTLADNCSCRKPNPGMLKRAEKELGVNLEKSWIIGDSVTDAEAGKAAGCRTILIGKYEDGLSDFVAKDFSEAVELILKNEKD